MFQRACSNSSSASSRKAWSSRYAANFDRPSLWVGQQPAVAQQRSSHEVRGRGGRVDQIRAFQRPAGDGQAADRQRVPAGELFLGAAGRYPFLAFGEQRRPAPVERLRQLGDRHARVGGDCRQRLTHREVPGAFEVRFLIEPVVARKRRVRRGRAAGAGPRPGSRRNSGLPHPPNRRRGSNRKLPSGERRSPRT